MSMNGIDVSGWQKGINLKEVPADFVIVKATQGTTYVNPDCVRAYQQAKGAGRLLGVYHYFSGGDPAAEAEFFVKNVKGYVGEAILGRRTECEVLAGSGSSEAIPGQSKRTDRSKTTDLYVQERLQSA